MGTGDAARLFREERHMRILQILEREHRAAVPDLANRLGVSEDTIRRDLRDLQSMNLVRKTHGGVLRHIAPPAAFEKRVGIEPELKTALGARAAELVEEGDAIIIDGATTALSVAHSLRVNKAKVLTNSLEVAQIIVQRPKLELIMLGGKWDAIHRQMVGAATIEQLQRYRVDKLFVGIGALDRRDGLTEPTEEDAAVKRAMMESAQQVIGLADHTKLGRVSFACVLPASAIDVLVTDDMADCSAFEDLNWQVIRVQASADTFAARSLAPEVDAKT
jgi:DeoR family transcriptional regulator, fructose operon transcriptional repressor